MDLLLCRIRHPTGPQSFVLCSFVESQKSGRSQVSPAKIVQRHAISVGADDEAERKQERKQDRGNEKPGIETPAAVAEKGHEDPERNAERGEDLCRSCKGVERVKVQVREHHVAELEQEELDHLSRMLPHEGDGCGSIEAIEARVPPGVAGYMIGGTGLRHRILFVP